MIFPVNSIHANALSEEDGERRGGCRNNRVNSYMKLEEMVGGYPR